MRATILPPVRGPATRATRWLLAVTLGVTSSCADDSPNESAPAGAALAPGAAAAAVDWSERLREPSVEDLLAALAQPHAAIRPHLGSHELTTSADLSLLPADAAPGVTPLDAPVVQPQAVHDELSLRWSAPDGASDGAPMRLRLSQTNDHDRGREVIVIDPTVHVRKAHRGWFHYPRDSDRIEQWLDDAQRSVHDVVELAAPQLSVQAAALEGAGLDGGAAVEITLGLDPAVHAERRAAGPTQAWRQGIELSAVEGTLRLDARSGAWLRADVNVRYRLTGADGRPLTGQARLTARVTPGAVTVEAPADSQPLPSRLRYDDEQRRLLDGLAAP